MKRIVILSNPFPGGWIPSDIETRLKGSESSLIEFASELARQGFGVYVYGQRPESEPVEETFEGVIYSTLDQVEIKEGDIVISFKNSNALLELSNVYRNKMIHWSCDVERPWNLNCLEHFVHISEYHERRHYWIPGRKSEAFPLGVDIDRLIRNKVDRIPNTALYSASPDRGLFELLTDWPTIKKHHPKLELFVTYGYEEMIRYAQNQVQAVTYADQLEAFFKQDDVHYLGNVSYDEISKLYWKYEYWIHPLNRADSELFCLNAIKARYCGMTSIVNRIGALQNTVGDHIDYKKFLQGSKEITKAKAIYNAMNWKQIVEMFWMPLFE